MKKAFKNLIAILLVAITAISLCSCARLSAEKVRNTLEKAGYQVGYNIDDLDERRNVVVIGSKENAEHRSMVVITWYKTEDYAKKMEQEDRERLKDKTDYEVGRKGKVVWWGTKDAVEASKIK
ncbi:MAG: hypothetical protein E7360_01995 [Clostridiales bacterium]|nr:hypothetical protein [Clostridiales bacterium]